MIYQFREGSRFKGSAQPVGERLAELTEREGGHLTPDVVVEDALDGNPALAPHIEADETVAATEWRKEQARGLIRSIRVVHVMDDGSYRPSLGYVHVDLPDTGPAYVTTARAVSEADLYEQAVSDCLSLLAGVRRRFEHIDELSDVFAAIDRAIEQAEVPKPKTERRRRAAQPANA